MEDHWKNRKNVSKELSIIGNSVAADYTGFEIPERGIFFDAGIASHRIPKIIAITHGHGDHTMNLPKILTNFIKLDCKKKPQKITILVPGTRGKRNTANFIKNYINSYFQLEMCSSLTVDKYINIVEMRGKSEEISKKKLKKLKSMGEMKESNEPTIYETMLSNTAYMFEAIDCYHSVPTVSYLLSQKKKKLQLKYRDMNKEDIIALSKSGVTVDETIIEPIMAYICDSSILVLEKNPHIFKYPVVMIECTFLDPNDIHEASKKRHIHWLELEPYIKKYSNIKFILFHFSSKHKPEYISAFFSKVHKSGLVNVDYFIKKI